MDAPWPHWRTAWITVGLLMAAAIVSQIDRMIINLVVQPIKLEFELSDARFGMLQGLAFGLFYTTMSIPIGMLADRFQRRAVIGIGIGFFSFFSLATGLAQNYFQIFLARVGVGIGEASVHPAGFSIISDNFPPVQLGRAISMFTLSPMLGVGLAYLGGGAAIGLLDELYKQSPEILMGMRPWQAAFIVVALPGFLLAPCFFLMREPVRRGLADQAPRLPFARIWAEIRRRGHFLALMFAGFGMVTTVSYSLSTWMPALFIRVYGWSPAHIGFWLGILYLTCATSGGFFAGWLVDRLAARGHADAPLKIAAYGFSVCGITGMLAPLMPGPELTLVFLAPTLFLQSMPYACAPTALQLILPNQMRAQVSALYIAFINLVGLAIGPIVVGLFTDYVFSKPGDVRYSLAIVIGIATPVMAALVLLSCKPYRALAQAVAAATN